MKNFEVEMNIQFTKTVRIEAPDEEFSAFIEKVRRTSLSREGFIRNMLAGVVIKERPPADVPYLLREIKRMGKFCSSSGAS